MKALKEIFGSVFNVLVIIIALVVGYYIWKNVMGNPINFEGGNPKGHPLQGNFLGMVYKGGYIVPLLMAIVLTVVTFVIERLISLTRASGRGRTSKFLRKIQGLINEGSVEEASTACDKQKGSLANVIKAGLYRYTELQNDKTLANDQKVLALQKDFEEATALELPMLSKNMVILSTIASVSVLTGLLGTVLGMIRAFGALATQGAPDALALSTGISEALINTAFGIAGSLIAILMYNYFSSQIDDMTYKIDEASFSIVQTFASTLKK
ncbi:MAG: MotA/TolQ/ExbB proton channel family protein [Bacteroidales bacterium]|nr:MotA/TolQ/ExbB proton channel family protein [Bacteroidales bacterium]